MKYKIKLLIVLVCTLLSPQQIMSQDVSKYPTIQEEWIDTGYFTWVDNVHTSLKITKLGAQQKALPDVSDGAQLTSANFMFSSIDYYSIQLKEVPFFNTSNITDFSGMFVDCEFLTTIPLLDTSKGIDFSRMFSRCKSLVQIPQLDTSKGNDFSAMFLDCHSLDSIPLLDTSNGMNFAGMFSWCRSLITIPQLNTSKGDNFSSMFSYCGKLESVPPLDTSNGTAFIEMFYGCVSLIKKPQLSLKSLVYDSYTLDMFFDTPFENK